MDSTTRNEARQVIAEIRNRQQELSERGDTQAVHHENLSAKVDDLTKAHRVLTERQFTEPTPHGGTSKLNEYVSKSETGGPVHWGPHEATTRLPECMGGHTVRSTEHGLLSDPNPADDWHADLIRLASKRNLARMAQRMSRAGGGRADTPMLDLDLYKHLMRCPAGELKVAMQRSFQDASGSGSEWIPDEFLPSVYQEFETPRRLRALFPEVQVTGNTVLIPRLTVGARPYVKGAISTDDPRKYTSSTPTTADTTISMSGLAVRVIADDAALEDSAVAASTILRREIVAALEDGFEDAMINGDSNATHQDTISSWNARGRWGASGLGGDADHRRLFLGFRAKAADTSATTALSGTMSVANFATMMGVLAERSVGNLVGIVSPEAMVADFLSLTQVLTVDAYGPSATVATGELGQLLGVPLVMSRFMTADLASTGLYTGSGSTTGCLLVDVDAYARYTKRGATVEVDKDITSGAVNMVATIREVMASPDPSGTKNVSFGINL